MKNEDIIIINLDFVNAFVLKVSGEFILIDTGMPFHWEKLESELIAAGCVPGKLKLIILTHGDVDHVGNCTKLREMYKCKIAMHKDDSHMVENGIPLKRKVRPLTGKIFFLIRKLKRRKLTFEKFKPDIYLSDGQNLNEYGLNAKVIHIPGHTKGSIGILTDDRKLFAGDIFTNRKKPDKAFYIDSYKELKNSYSRLKTMNIKMIYPGHGKPFELQKIVNKL